MREQHGGVRDGGTLRLTDDGIEMPEMLKGYVGQFEIKTATITAQFNTTEQGLPTDDYSDEVWATYPGDGGYHAHLDAGEMLIQCRGAPDTLFEVVDERSGEVGGE
jgi:hypothetical protein